MSEEKTEDAKFVFDVEWGWIDRTQGKHKYPFDIDVRKPSAPNGKNHWIYWGSSKTIKSAEKKLKNSWQLLQNELGLDVQARIVEAKTGEVLKTFP